MKKLLIFLVLLLSTPLCVRAQNVPTPVSWSVGTLAQRPGSCQPGQGYLASDTKNSYFCGVVNGAYAWVATTSGGSLNINGSAVSNLNLNSTSPAADSGYVAATMKVSGSNAIAEVPNSVVASGTATLGTGTITSATCATVVTVAGAGIATTDTLTVSFNGDPTAVTGYIPSTAGMLTIIAYPTSGNANFKVCNNTGSSITPGAITLNWRVAR